MNVLKQIILLVSVFCSALPARAMDSGDGNNNLLGQALKHPLVTASVASVALGVVAYKTLFSRPPAIYNGPSFEHILNQACIVAEDPVDYDTQEPYKRSLVDYVTAIRNLKEQTRQIPNVTSYDRTLFDQLIENRAEREFKALLTKAEVTTRFLVDYASVIERLKKQATQVPEVTPDQLALFDKLIEAKSDEDAKAAQEALHKEQEALSRKEKAVTSSIIEAHKMDVLRVAAAAPTLEEGMALLDAYQAKHPAIDISDLKIQLNTLR